MKRICFTTLLILCGLSIHAQKIKNGSFHALANESKVNLTLDYTESTIDNMPFETFLEVEEHWEKGYREIVLKLIKSANQYSNKLIYTTKKETNYQLVYKAISVSRTGYTNGYLILLDKDKNVVGETDNYYINGGRYGSQLNLMGDASENIGKNIAKFINKQIKKAVKR